MNNVLQYLTYLNVGFAAFLIFILIVLLLEFITRMISQILNNFDWFKSLAYWLSNSNIINNILYYVAVITGVLILIILFVGLGQMVLGH